MKQAGILAMMLLASVAPGSQARAQVGHGGDSAAVAGVIAKYHEAMAAGDSATALALLTDDAVILTKTFAMAAASLLSVTLVPVTMGLFIRGRMFRERANPLNRALIRLYRRP